jgi:hypothetical protein
MSRRYTVAPSALADRDQIWLYIAPEANIEIAERVVSGPALFPNRTILVHNGVMRTANKAVRQSVSLPANVAAQVRNLAKARRLSANRMLLELIENGMEAEKRKQQEFFDLAERFRRATDPEEVKRLGDQMGRMVFGG